MSLRRRHRVPSRRYGRAAGFCAWLAPLMAFVVAMAPALASLHRALVPHLVCEHGDMIEVDEDQAKERSSVAEGLAATVIENSGAGAHRHDHCLFAALARTASAPARGQAALLRGAQSRVLQSVTSERRLIQSILAFAPKTSPPPAPHDA